MWKIILAMLLTLFLVGCLSGCVSNAGKLSFFYSQEVGFKQEPIDKTDKTIEVDFKTTLWEAITGWWKSPEEDPE